MNWSYWLTKYAHFRSRDLKAASSQDQIIRDFGTIYVLVNNAGFAATGALEAASDEAIRQQLETNLVGLIKVTQTVLPQMRKQRDG